MCVLESFGTTSAKFEKRTCLITFIVLRRYCDREYHDNCFTSKAGEQINAKKTF